MKYKLSFLLLLALFFLLTVSPFQADETRVFVPRLKPFAGNWIGVNNVTVAGTTYPNAYSLGSSCRSDDFYYYLDYVISHRYKYFSAEIGCRDDAANEDSEEVVICGERGQEIYRKTINLGEPPIQLMLPVSEFVRLRICRKVCNYTNVVWINPYFIK